MRFYEISNNELRSTYQVLLSGLPHDPRMDILFTLMSVFGPISEIELFHTIDAEELMNTYCQVHFETRQAAQLAASTGSVCYKGQVVDVESIHEISVDDPETDHPKPRVKDLLASKRSDLMDSAPKRLKMWHDSLQLRRDNEKSAELEKDASKGPTRLQQMLKRTVMNKEYSDAQKRAQISEGGLSFHKSCKRIR